MAGPVILLLTLNQRFYFALIMSTLTNVIRKYSFNLSYSVVLVWYCTHYILRFDGISFGSAGSSKEGHRLTLGMGNYKNMALTRDPQTEL